MFELLMYNKNTQQTWIKNLTEDVLVNEAYWVTVTKEVPKRNNLMSRIKLDREYYIRFY